ncbi:hypothetical protein ES703_104210 [subsurface metagenome]
MLIYYSKLCFFITLQALNLTFSYQTLSFLADTKKSIILFYLLTIKINNYALKKDREYIK